MLYQTYLTFRIVFNLPASLAFVAAILNNRSSFDKVSDRGFIARAVKNSNQAELRHWINKYRA